MHRGEKNSPGRVTFTPIWSSVTSPDFLAVAAKHKCQIGSEIAARVVPRRKIEPGAGTTHRRAASRRRRLGSREEAAASPWLVLGKMNSAMSWRQKGCAFITERQDSVAGCLVWGVRLDNEQSAVHKTELKI